MTEATEDDSARGRVPVVRLRQRRRTRLLRARLSRTACSRGSRATATRCRSPSTRASSTTSRRSCAPARSTRRRRCSGCASARTARDRHVVLAAVDLAEFAGNTVVVDADRPKFSRFVREVFGPRAKALGFIPQGRTRATTTSCCGGRCCASSRPRIRSSPPKRAGLRALDPRPEAIDPGFVDVVLVTAGRTGDAALFDALLAEAKATQDRPRSPLSDDGALRVHGSGARAEGDGASARSGVRHPRIVDRTAERHSLESDAACDQRLHHGELRRAGEDGGARHARRWPVYASGLCTESDRAELAAFWKERAQTYAGADRELAQALESIDLCTRVRSATGRAGIKD